MKKKCLKVAVDICLDDITKEYFNTEGTIYKIDNEDIHCNDDYCPRCSCQKFCGILNSDAKGFYLNYKKISNYLIKQVNKKAEGVRNGY